MEAESVEDNGSGILFNVYVYNTQPGVSIDYATGESWLNGESPEETKEEDKESKSQKEKNTESKEASEDGTYILNTNTKKFHYPSCSSVKRMSEKNKEEFSGNRSSLIEDGYEPCENCNP